MKTNNKKSRVNTSPPNPQYLRWGPVDGKDAGVQVIGGIFIPWKRLHPEFMQRLLPQVANLNNFHNRYDIRVQDFEKKRNWILKIVLRSSKQLAFIWIGPNPQALGAPWDGLIRIGTSFNPPEIWNVFQRYSDGTYIRLPTPE